MQLHVQVIWIDLNTRHLLWLAIKYLFLNQPIMVYFLWLLNIPIPFKGHIPTEVMLYELDRRSYKLNINSGSNRDKLL